ncbi:hypothetical protein C9374_000239 [Naegleria lovaniensis]|uniref:Uncharacterized protein n=1 Tax=Naegleria lovaniensis TaxID=51637 RepID=A0AA88GXF0_NAELO|nr:uncharacterized protein C9374_000239 [Naegleria lovaniensis]KAG2388800.1 hypothetical protein C9374_000239 [Naegleria lovaniensis]
MQTPNPDHDELTSSLSSLEYIVPRINYSSKREAHISEMCTQIYEKVQREYNLYLSSEFHDIRNLLSHNNRMAHGDWNKTNQNKDISRKYEDYSLSHRDTFNWNQIKQALKHDYPNFTQFQTIEEANVFNPPSEEDETLSQSLPLTAEYWRRRQQELSTTASSETNKTEDIPKLRIKHRINAPPKKRK